MSTAMASNSGQAKDEENKGDIKLLINRPGYQPRAPSLLSQLLDLEELDPNLYRGYNPRYGGWGRIYGGQTVAQALVAAGRTVEPQFVVHSLHAYFVLAGDDTIPILYQVDRIRDGNSYATRTVVAIQRGRAIFSMSVSFAVREQEAKTFQAPMPEVKAPKEYPTWTEAADAVMKDPRTPASVKERLELHRTFPFPAEYRSVNPPPAFQPTGPLPPKKSVWVKVEGKLDDSYLLHQCALAYLSDWGLLSTALLPLGMSAFNWNKTRQASLDHSMWFHQSFRADDYLLYDTESHVYHSNRTFCSGRFFTRDGRLVVSVAQEGMIRFVKQPTTETDAKASKTRKLSADAKEEGSGIGEKQEGDAQPRAKL